MLSRGRERGAGQVGKGTPSPEHRAVWAQPRGSVVESERRGKTVPEDPTLSQGSREERSEGAVYPDRGAAPAGFRQTGDSVHRNPEKQVCFFFFFGEADFSSLTQYFLPFKYDGGRG